jgi:hypothetical protein
MADTARYYRAVVKMFHYMNKAKARLLVGGKQEKIGETIIKFRPDRWQESKK